MKGTSVDGAAASVSLSKWRSDFSCGFQYYLDRSTPHIIGRWLGTLVVAVIYVLHVYSVQVFYIVSYRLGIYVPYWVSVPNGGSEIGSFGWSFTSNKGFKFWYSITKAFCVAFVLTFFSIFDVLVLWPILLFYWIVLFVLTMKHQILHMIKYKYDPFSMGKQRYGGKKVASSSSTLSSSRTGSERRS